MTTTTKPGVEVMESLDWPLECQANYHAEHGDGTAVWAVWTDRCCSARSDFGFMCDACLQYSLHSMRGARCRDCGHRVDLIRHHIKRYERIKA